MNAKLNQLNMAKLVASYSPSITPSIKLVMSTCHPRGLSHIELGISTTQEHTAPQGLHPELGPQAECAQSLFSALDPLKPTLGCAFANLEASSAPQKPRSQGHDPRT